MPAVANFYWIYCIFTNHYHLIAICVNFWIDFKASVQLIEYNRFIATVLLSPDLFYKSVLCTEDWYYSFYNYTMKRFVYPPFSSVSLVLGNQATTNYQYT